MRMQFLQNLVDDRSESVMSYYEYLVHLQKQLSKWRAVSQSDVSRKATRATACVSRADAHLGAGIWLWSRSALVMEKKKQTILKNGGHLCKVYFTFYFSDHKTKKAVVDFDNWRPIDPLGTRYAHGRWNWSALWSIILWGRLWYTLHP